MGEVVSLVQRNEITRDQAIQRIKTALKKRSGRPWSVTGGRGTAWGWIHIKPFKKYADQYGNLTPEDQVYLGKLLGLDRPVHCQGESIPASWKYRAEYVDRAEGRTPKVCGEPYWDD
jgi:hypothetical protein